MQNHVYFLFAFVFLPRTLADLESCLERAHLAKTDILTLVDLNPQD